MANDQVEAVGAVAADGTDASVVANDTKANKVGDAGVTIEIAAFAPILPHKTFRNLCGSEGMFWKYQST